MSALIKYLESLNLIRIRKIKNTDMRGEWEFVISKNYQLFSSEQDMDSPLIKIMARDKEIEFIPTILTVPINNNLLYFKDGLKTIAPYVLGQIVGDNFGITVEMTDNGQHFVDTIFNKDGAHNFAAAVVTYDNLANKELTKDRFYINLKEFLNKELEGAREKVREELGLQKDKK